MLLVLLLLLLKSWFLLQFLRFQLLVWVLVELHWMFVWLQHLYWLRVCRSRQHLLTE